MERLLGSMSRGRGVLVVRAVWPMQNKLLDDCFAHDKKRLRHDAALAILKERMRPVQVEQQRVNRLIDDLDSARFAVRAKASDELGKLGSLAGPALRKALAARPPLEARQRLEQLLNKLDGPITSPETLQMLRALEVLERIGTPEARQILLSLAKGAPEAALTQEAKASLERLGK